MNSTATIPRNDQPPSPQPVVGRFAPTPSGRMHLGNIYSALIAWLSVRSQGGRIVMRIEDLDPRTQSGPWTTLLLEDMRWLGLYWDEGPYFQRERQDLYASAVATLDQDGLLYPCFCTRAELHAASAPHASDGTPIYAGSCRNLSATEIAERARTRPAALRLRVPDKCDPSGQLAIDDRVYGHVEETLARDCGDFLVQRSDGVFAYQLAVVVDDADMGITEVVRGRDLLDSSVRQTYLQNLLGYRHPRYAHIPLLTAKDGRRLSKRDRDQDIEALRERFGAPEALLGWLAHRTGLVEDLRPRSADNLVDLFSWDVVRHHRDNIAIQD